MKQKKEIWIPVPEYENYYISNMGKIKNKTGLMSVYTSKQNQRSIHLWKNRKRKWFLVSHLVVLAFLGKWEKDNWICHKNKIKTDDRLSNLMIVSPSISIYLDYALKKKPIIKGRRKVHEHEYNKNRKSYNDKKYNGRCSVCGEPISESYKARPRECKNCSDKKKSRRITFGKERERKQLNLKQMQRCHHCKEIKSFDDFSKSKKTKNGILGICRKCWGEYIYRRKYGNAT